MSVKTERIKQPVDRSHPKYLIDNKKYFDIDDIIVDGEYRKWIDGYDGRYSIDKDCRVFSHWNKFSKQVRLMEHSPHRDGYVRVVLSKNNKGRMRYLHRLMMETFVSNTENKKTVNHIDGNKTNNKLSNLEWATYQENSRHAFDNCLNVQSGRVFALEETIMARIKRARFTSDEASEILEMMDILKIKPTPMAKIIGCDKETILNLVLCKTKHFKDGVVLP